MPEGPEIHRAADRIARALKGRVIRELFFAFDHLKPYQDLLRMQVVDAVEPRGKALLTRFSEGLSLYTHNQLYGKWYVCKPGKRPKTNRQLRVALHNDNASALLYSASEIEVLLPRDIDTHPFLSALGPDVLAPNTDVPTIIACLDDDRSRRRQLATLLLDQHVLSGLGNYLRSEILFIAGLHPRTRPADLDASGLKQLAEVILNITRRAYDTGGITLDPARVAALKKAKRPRRAYRHFVFGRINQPCHVCATTIEKHTIGGRRLYLCPHCQART